MDGGVVSLQLRHASFDHGRRRSAARSSRGRKRFQLKLKPRTPPELVRECGLEWTGFDVDPAQAYLGLSLATALQALDVTAWDADRLASVPRALTGAADPVTPIFPATADPFFRGDWLRVRGSLATEAGFAILVGHRRRWRAGQLGRPVPGRRRGLRAAALRRRPGHLHRLARRHPLPPARSSVDPVSGS
ncbi:MAG TPA: hypothetical protein VNP03_08870 [Pseudonocardia sp.]|nr:hypothetical protein [Pseudonocardia sp.]